MVCSVSAKAVDNKDGLNAGIEWAADYLDYYVANVIRAAFTPTTPAPDGENTMEYAGHPDGPWTKGSGNATETQDRHGYVPDMESPLHGIHAVSEYACSRCGGAKSNAIHAPVQA